MPELAGEVTARSLLTALGIAGVLVVAFCAAVTLAARNFPASTVWAASGMVVGGLSLIAFAQLYLEPLVMQEVSLGYAAFFLAALLGLPSAAAVWAAVRRAARPNRGGFLFDSVLVTATFLVVLPLAGIVASVPDMLALLG